MEVNGEEERRSRRVYFSDLLNCPCSAFHKALQAILKCFGLESSSSSSSSSTQPLLEEEDLRNDETVEERGFMAMVIALLRRRPRQRVSPGRPGQINQNSD